MNMLKIIWVASAIVMQKCYAWINYFNIFRPGPMDRSLGTADNGL